MEMIEIARIKGTHHLRGALKVESSYSIFKDLSTEKVLIQKDKDIKLLEIKSIKFMNKKRYIVEFVGIDTVEKAKNLISYTIKIRENLIPDIAENNFNASDLISFKVYEDNKYLGRVYDILETAAHDILIISNEEIEFMLPFVENEFILNIDFEKKILNVKLIEGIL